MLELPHILPLAVLLWNLFLQLCSFQKYWNFIASIRE